MGVGAGLYILVRCCRK